MTVADLEKRVARLEKAFERAERGRDYQESLAAIREGLAQADRGESVPAKEAIEEIRNRLVEGGKANASKKRKS
ncbi:MAG TPA: hypothetical protein VGB55_01710 [Tepidisphaeraceae bacterium]